MNNFSSHIWEMICLHLIWVCSGQVTEVEKREPRKTAIRPWLVNVSEIPIGNQGKTQINCKQIFPQTWRKQLLKQKTIVFYFVCIIEVVEFFSSFYASVWHICVCDLFAIFSMHEWSININPVWFDGRLRLSYASLG